MSKIYVDEIHPKTVGGTIEVNRKDYYFSVRKNDGNNVGVNTDIVFNTVDEDTEGLYNSSTGVITVPVAGIWQFNFIGMSNYNGQTGVGFYDSTTTHINRIGTFTESTSNSGLSMAFAIRMNANDTIKARCVSGTVYAGSGNGHVRLNGYLIG